MSLNYCFFNYARDEGQWWNYGRYKVSGEYGAWFLLTDDGYNDFEIEADYYSYYPVPGNDDYYIVALNPLYEDFGEVILDLATNFEHQEVIDCEYLIDGEVLSFGKK